MASSRRTSGLRRPFTYGTFPLVINQFEQLVREFSLLDSDYSPDEIKQIKVNNEAKRFEEFSEAVRIIFGSEIRTQNLKAIFRKINNESSYSVDWSELFGYAAHPDLTEALQNDDNISNNVFLLSRRSTVGEAAGDKRRRDGVKRIMYIAHNDIFVTATEKGTLCVWNSDESAWVTDCCNLPSLRRIAICSERSIALWDHRAKRKQQTVVQIRPIERSPRCVSHCILDESEIHEDVLIFGDDQGYVNMMRISAKDLHMKSSEKGEASVVSVEPSKLTHKILKRKLHDDWVLKIRYYTQLKAFVSCSPCNRQSLVIVDLEDKSFDTAPHRSMSLFKGVNAFDYSPRANAIVTGGIDKILRLWHPNILARPTGKMSGHLFTIVDICINEKDQHIISLSTARIIRIWDIQTLTSLQSFCDIDIGSTDKRLSAIFYDNKYERLLTGTTVISCWPLTRTVQDSMFAPHTHERAVSQILFNHHSNQVATACAESTIKMWDVETGRLIYQILDSHGASIEVTSMVADNAGNILATGGFDGSIKTWDFSTGTPIRVLNPEAEKLPEEPVIGLLFTNEAEWGRCLLGIGWGNKLKIFKESLDEPFLEEVVGIEGSPPPDSPVVQPATPLNSAEIGKRARHHAKSNAPSPILDLIQASDLWRFFGKQLFDVTCVDFLKPTYIVIGSHLGNIYIGSLITKQIITSFRTLPIEQNRQDGHKVDVQVNASVILVSIYVPKNKLTTRNRLTVKEVEVESEENDDFMYQKELTEKVTKLPRKNTTLMLSRLQIGTRDETNTSGDENNTKETQPGLPAYAESNVESDRNESHSEVADKSNSLEGSSNDQIRKTNPDVNSYSAAQKVCSMPLVLTSHNDGYMRFWNMKGNLLAYTTTSTNRHGTALPPITALCASDDSHYVFSANSKGYITKWNISKFMQNPRQVLQENSIRRDSSIATQLQADDNSRRRPLKVEELIVQILTWRAHLFTVTSLKYFSGNNILFSASTDCSVRVWHCRTGHFIGYFGQPRNWHLNSFDSIPSTPARPSDIQERPLLPVKNVTKAESKKRKENPSLECPLFFDNAKWKPFRRSAPAETRPKDNKKFFGALAKAKIPNSDILGSSRSTLGVFSSLPMYRLNSPKRIKAPATEYKSSFYKMDLDNDLGDEEFPDRFEVASSYQSSLLESQVR
ncbi:uncharacterized protein TRIADDRAFT_59845 [Trichoplax adhaerens]|uniref:WD repeat-containing protein on Y chromosome n=1 Tax=Trichoplax adhaerens TaxID=10228 RepID=B3S6L2_TRIAD|nr:hypothetical protein TRIADDRAFT_59845 [Trichoplax adhaerens]EDV21639.1 hypothetical protein TRIADDRAFT_59845 [Trichoplax adhaerens]|eukprot:XP_002115787.1 hypothetical protein TRIADDRAFT_59845 [Trichoplax adhaerens]